MKLKIHFDWDHNIPEYDPEIHNPEKVFAFLLPEDLKESAANLTFSSREPVHEILHEHPAS